MSKPVFADLLGLQGRRNRKSYVQLNLVLIAICMLAPQPAMYMMESMDAQQIHAVEDIWDLPAMVYLDVIFYAVGIPSFILVFIALVQRCHDIGWSGWWALLLPVPVIGFFFWAAMFFVRGDRGENQFGLDPLEPSTREPVG